MSGGQLGDKGSIDGIEVLDVYEKNDDIIHVLSDLPKNEIVELCINWDIRFQNMQQHTGQHIVSNAFSKLLDFETISFHMTKDFNYIDMKANFLNQNIIDKIESYSNRIVFSNFEIYCYISNHKNLSKIPLRGTPKKEKDIRIVEINNLDFCACGGTHHRRTGEVGLIKLINWYKIKENYRVEFVCGVKALEDYNFKNNIITKLKNDLSININETLESINKIKSELEDYKKSNTILKSKLIDYKTIWLKNNSIKYKNIKIISDAIDEFDLNETRKIINNISCYNNYVMIIGINQNNKSQFIIAKSSNLNIDIKNIFDKLLYSINGNGGGNENIYQGGCNEPNKAQSIVTTGLNLIKEEINR
jgi:alanyl-tRNA synthetase